MNLKTTLLTLAALLALPPLFGQVAGVSVEPAAVLPPETPLFLWLIFAVIVCTSIAVDLFANRHAHKKGVREALLWVIAWISLALLFNGGVWLWRGPNAAIEFLVGYLVELNLSVDNLFVFLVIFSYFGVSAEFQPRVLSWGILGAIVLRLVFIFVGIELVEQFKFLIYVFGAILVFTGLKLLFHKSDEMNPEKSLVVRITRKLLPMTDRFHGQSFFVREPFSEVAAREGSGSRVHGQGDIGTSTALSGRLGVRKGRLLATPLFLVLLVIETTDIVFAVDSVPAILGITRDRFVAFSSNVFAILGLRSMFFVLTAFLDKFHYLKIGLSFVLVFIGVKMLIEHWFKMPPVVALAVVVAILGISLTLSLAFPIKAKPLPPEDVESNGTTADKNDN